MENLEIYESADLAFAAYAELNSDEATDSASNLVALKEAGMSERQAQEFAARYPEVVTQFDDPETGFDATVFKSADGELVLAIRGTIPGDDGDILPTDADIFTKGAGYDQIVAMTNWWLKESSPAGEMVQQYALAEYSDLDTIPADAVYLYSTNQGSGPLPITTAMYLVPEQPVAATGNLAGDLAANNGTLSQVTGHSLGGHLAMAFESLFASQTTEVTVYNAPGFINDAANQQFFDGLVSGANVPTGANTTNVIADEASVGEAPWRGIAGLHSRPGTPIDIAIENQWLSDEPNPPNAKNHSQMVLTDALAVFNVLTQLDNGLTTESVVCHQSTDEVAA